ncbi:hypothetical protein GCM10010406_18390 [Streptomyces thermolineatus]|uniref:DUF2228 domain-containing protein n=1 Tax=Streptomyces thermolineatus TaxID=44033 RepID=A0ABN3LG95_9ACTN
MGEDRGRDSGTAVAERFLRDWGIELPDSLLRFRAFLDALGPEEREALAELSVAPAGVMDLFADPGRQPRDGLDVRVHGRFYPDPPEFVTFMYSGSDGLHHGLWSDDGRTCDSVASYWTNDGGGITRKRETPLEAVRALLERHWRDLDDYGAAGDDVSGERRRAGLLREALTAFATGDRTEVGLAYSRAYDFAAEPVDPGRITTLDGAGALVSGGTALDRPAHNGADEYAFATHMNSLFEDAAALEACVDEARRRLAAGDPAEALVLGRDLHRASCGHPAREAYANELLVAAYRALDRPSLAGIAEAHHRHRSLPHVDVLGPRGK